MRDVENVTLAGGFAADSARVECERERANFVFLNVTGLRLQGLHFLQCGQKLGRELLYEAQTVQTRSFFLFDGDFEKAALFIVNVEDLFMDQVTVENSAGYGLLGMNILGKSSIERVYFYNNNRFAYDIKECMNATGGEYLFSCYGISMAIAYMDVGEQCPQTPVIHTLSISSCEVSRSVNPVESSLGSGLLVAMSQSNYGVEVNMDNVTCTHNQGSHGANMAFLVYDLVDNSSISINNSFSGYSNPDIFIRPEFETRSYIGGALFYSYGIPIPTIFAPACLHSARHNSELLQISNSEIVGNAGGGVFISFDTVVESGIQFHIALHNVSFVNNVDNFAPALLLNQLEPIHQVELVSFIINQSTFINNTALHPASKDLDLKFQSPIHLYTLQSIAIVDSSFVANFPTPIFAYKTNIHFNGDCVFKDNVGVFGGAIGLHENSFLLLTPNTHIQFVNNTALKRGGGLYISSRDALQLSLCFFQIDHSDFTDLDIAVEMIAIPNNITHNLVDIAEGLDIRISFEDNRAGEAGASLYGGWVDTCTIVSTRHLVNYRDQSGAIFDQLFVFDNISSNHMSTVSSDPLVVCLCERNVPNCSITHTSKSIFAGQTFELSVLTFGQRDGISPGVVYADFITSAGSYIDAPSLAPSQRTQTVGHSCTSLEYSVDSHTHNTMMSLSTGQSKRQCLYVDVSLLDCPPGFKLSDKTPLNCVCEEILADSDIVCSIETQTISRHPPLWISYDNNRGMLLHLYCPFDYCNAHYFELNVSEPDSQCSSGRTGVLCGACQEDYSRTLGSSECKKCSSSYLFLLIVFVMVGLVFVLLPYIFNFLTVSVGAINGLIFYANIVQVNRGVFFPPGEHNILTVFISWINLDLGITTCFYNGMDEYAKTWLQFVFPVYIWLIATLIIVLSHYSSRVATLTGNNGVPVLATLLLLSFAKLQRTIYTALSFTYISQSDGTHSVVWAYDGTMPYLQGRHAYLFMFSLLTLIFISFPFTFLVLLSPYLQVLSARKMFRWVNKLKPFLDAYQGPYRDKHRYSTGALILTRGVLFLFYTFNYLYRFLLVLIVTMLIFLGYGWISSGGVYKKWTLNLLEFSYFLNLGTLSAATLYIGVAGGSQAVVAYTSVSIALLEFLGIVVVNVYSRFFASRCRRWLQLLRSYSTKSGELAVDIAGKRRAPATVTTIEFNPLDCEDRERSETFSVVLREPLLDSAYHSQ